jgi:hypothetical protein
MSRNGPKVRRATSAAVGSSKTFFESLRQALAPFAGFSLFLAVSSAPDGLPAPTLLSSVVSIFSSDRNHRSKVRTRSPNYLSRLPFNFAQSTDVFVLEHNPARLTT